MLFSYLDTINNMEVYQPSILHFLWNFCFCLNFPNFDKNNALNKTQKNLRNQADTRPYFAAQRSTYESRRLQLLTTLLQTVVIRVRNLVGIRHESLVSVSAEPTFFAVQPKASCLSNFATFRHSCCRSNVG